MLKLIFCLLNVAAASEVDEGETAAVMPGKKRTTKFEGRMTKEEMEEEQRSVFPYFLNVSNKATISPNRPIVKSISINFQTVQLLLINYSFLPKKRFFSHVHHNAVCLCLKQIVHPKIKCMPVHLYTNIFLIMFITKWFYGTIDFHSRNNYYYESACPTFLKITSFVISKTKKCTT